MKTNAPTFFSTILQAGVIAHQLHLSTTSYADHKALEKLYEGIPDHADTLIESWQGRNQLIKTYPVPDELPADSSRDFVGGLADYISENRAAVGEESQLQNIVDELAGLVDQTLHRLKYLS